MFDICSNHKRVEELIELIKQNSLCEEVELNNVGDSQIDFGGDFGTPSGLQMYRTLFDKNSWLFLRGDEFEFDTDEEEKDFGYNSGKVDLNSRNHKEWRWFLSDLFKLFEVVSFDNLALEQLKPERFLTKKDFDTFNQGEYSMYINAVEGYFSPSSRSNYIFNWGMISIKDFFKNKESLMNDCKVSLSIGMFDSSVYLQGTGI